MVSEERSSHSRDPKEIHSLADLFPRTIPRTIADALQKSNLRLSTVCHSIIAAAACWCLAKRDERYVLSTSTMFLTAAYVGSRLSNMPPSSLAAIQSTEIDQLLRLSRFVCGNSPHDAKYLRFSELLGGFFENSFDDVSEEMVKSEIDRVNFSRSMVRSLDAIGFRQASIYDLSFQDLLECVLSVRSQMFDRRLDELRVDKNALRKAVIESIGELNTSTSPERPSSPVKSNRGETLWDLGDLDGTDPNDIVIDLGGIAGESSSPQEESPVTRRLSVQVSRELVDLTEESLGVEVYARALATLFRTAPGEFCFGLLGHWGIGKTYLARKCANLLRDPRAYSASLGDKLSSALSDPAFAFRYEVVEFSAWKFRRTPDAWVSLYEAFADRCMGAPVLIRMRRVLRYGVEKNGYWPLVFGLVALGVAALPFGLWMQLFLIAVSLVGLFGLIHVFRLFQRSRNPVSMLASRYTALVHHKEKLGMQALIGDELKSLMTGWIPKDRCALSWRSVFAVGALLVVSAAWFWALPSAQFMENGITVLCSQLLPGKSDLCGSLSPAAPPWLPWLVWFLWNAAWIAVLGALHVGGGKTDRVLLIVDDLDRCNPDELIELIESLKLMLEDKDIQDRVQVLMLVDEDVLDHAIAQKFSGLIEDHDRRGGESRARSAVVREHMEKLFTCHLRLPGLSEEEVDDLAVRYAGRNPNGGVAVPPADKQTRGETVGPDPTRPTREPDSADLADRRDAPDGAGGEAADAGLVGPRRDAFDAGLEEGEGEPPGTHTSSTIDQDNGERFTSAELRVIRSHLRMARLRLVQSQSHRHLSPRAIRTFMFKVQLGRMLLILSDQEYDANALIGGLADNCFDELKTGGKQGVAGRRGVRSVIRQVA